MGNVPPVAFTVMGEYPFVVPISNILLPIAPKCLASVPIIQPEPRDTEPVEPITTVSPFVETIPELRDNIPCIERLLANDKSETLFNVRFFNVEIDDGSEYPEADPLMIIDELPVDNSIEGVPETGLPSRMRVLFARLKFDEVFNESVPLTSNVRPPVTSN